MFDIVVIGGGITGAGAALEATLRGFKVLLLDGNDFASGTSSKSSKLIHGGLRYLENLEFKLVAESVIEKKWLVSAHPKVNPISFYLPSRKTDRVPKNVMRLGLWLYDSFSFFKFRHSFVKKKEIEKELPFLRNQNLLGAFKYSDATMWDDQLTIDTIRLAKENGAVCLNYQWVESVEEKKINGSNVIISTRNGDEKKQFFARWIVFCAGAFSDVSGKKLFKNWKKLIQPSQGTHLVLKKEIFHLEKALVLSDEKTKRVSFVIPRMDMGSGVYLFGTTDYPSPENPSLAKTSSEEIQFLKDLFFDHFNFELRDEMIIGSYVGVRPLVVSEETTLSKVSREHVILKVQSYVTAVAGGKYTTYRAMAKEILDRTIEYWIEDSPNSFPVGILKKTKWPKFLSRPDFEWSLNGRLKNLDFSLNHEDVRHLHDFIFRRSAIGISTKDYCENEWDLYLDLMEKKMNLNRDEEKQILIEMIKNQKIN